VDAEAETPLACQNGQHVMGCAPIATVATKPFNASHSGMAFYGCLLCGYGGQLVAEVFSWRQASGSAVLVAGRRQQ
jgi:hypothetical protein